MSEKNYNYILMKMVYTGNDQVGRNAVVIDDWNIKTLVGEYKIMLDKIKFKVNFTEEEQEEQRAMIKKWEADLYD